MRDYGKVHTSFWSSSNIRKLSDDARTMALYLLTCPHGTLVGVFRLPDGYATEDLQWSAERVSVTLSELLDNGFCNRCETTKWVWIRKFLEWNPPENPNQRKAAAKLAAQIPDSCSWKREFSMAYVEILGEEGDRKTNRSGTLQKPLRNQEQEQEQEQKKKDSAEKKFLDACASPPVVSIPLIDGSEHGITDGEVSELSKAYPAVDVPQQLRHIREWCKANPAKRKTKRGVAGFIVRWLGKAQDQGGAGPRSIAGNTATSTAFAGAI